MKSQQVRTGLLAVFAIALIAAAAPAPVIAQGGSDNTRLCDELVARVKSIPKGDMKSPSLPTRCGATGVALGIFRSMRIIVEACKYGGGENAEIMKMLDDFVTKARDTLAKECR